MCNMLQSVDGSKEKNMEGTISTIIVAVITGIVTIVNTVISKRTSKKVDSISDLKKDIADMREESKKDILEHTLDADKTFLINFLSELENGIIKTDIQIKRAYEIYERYSKNRWK